LELGVDVTTPYPQDVLDGKDDYGEDLENVEYIPELRMDTLYGIENYSKNIKENQNNDEDVKKIEILSFIALMWDNINELINTLF
jgi:hypothetical protein